MAWLRSTPPPSRRSPTLARAARAASRRLALLSRADKDAALRALADALDAATDRDRRGQRRGPRARPRVRYGRRACSTASPSTPPRVAAVAQALRDVAALPDPVGEVVRGSTLANGLQIRQVRVPMGVVGMVYEARPNVTVDAAGLGLKCGNAVILRGGSAAASTNRALVDVLRARPGGARGCPPTPSACSRAAATPCARCSPPAAWST